MLLNNNFYYSLKVSLVGFEDYEISNTCYDFMIQPDNLPNIDDFYKKISKMEIFIVVVKSCLLDHVNVSDWILNLSLMFKNDKAKCLCLTEWPNDTLLQKQLSESLKGLDQDLNQLSIKYYNDLKNAKYIEVHSTLGTEMFLKLNGRKVFTEDFFSLYCENIIQIPCGEVYVAPDEDFTSGIIRLPIKMLGVPQLDLITEICVKEGRITNIHVPNSRILTKKTQEIHIVGQKIGEFGIGTNKYVSKEVFAPWIEKAWGTVHFGVGNNTHFGGENRSDMHIDITVPNIDVAIDGKLILQEVR